MKVTFLLKIGAEEVFPFPKFVKGLRHCALVGFCWDEFLNGCSPDLLFGTENELSQKNHEGWLVGVWDGDSWDPSQQFWDLEWSSQQNPNNIPTISQQEM